MITMTLGEVARLVGGVVDPSAGDVEVTAEAFVDSRSPVPGGLYLALAGERVDGHAYAAAAVAAGAAGVLAARPVPTPATVVVDDVVAAVGVLAAELMRRVPDCTVFGLTGSQGKTSTKDLLAAIVGSAAPTVSTLGSQNAELGVPLTALKVVPGTRYVVCEMGARGLGHISYLTEIMRPTVGLVLNVGVAHVGEFGSQEGIAAAKGELVEALPADGLAVLNADDPRVAAMATRTVARVVTFGTGPDADLRVGGVRLDGDGHTRFTLGWDGDHRDIALGYVGAHHAMNAGAAAAAALGSGLGLDAVAGALAGLRPVSKWRMEVSTSPDGVVVVNDAYNANPDSMRAALDALVDIAGQRAARPVAVLGEMFELGDTSRGEHEAMGRLVAGMRIGHLVVVGSGARPMYDAARAAASWAGSAEFAADPGEALQLARAALHEGDVVLVKASRAAGLDGLAAALTAKALPTDRTGGGG